MSKQKPKTVNMLLDVSNYFGDTNKRLKPIIIILMLLCIPPFIHINLLYSLIPFKYFLPIYGIYFIRCIMIVIGEEGKRLAAFKRRLYGEYASVYTMMDIKTITDEGVIEYNNGTIAICIVAENGSDCDPIQRANDLGTIIDGLARNDAFDIMIQNVPDTEALFSRYDSVVRVKDKNASRNYMLAIDHYINKTKRESSNIRIVYVLRGRRDEVKNIFRTIEVEMRNEALKTYKTFKLADKALVEDIISRDIDTYIDFMEFITKRYATGTYAGSEVIDYDVENRLADEEYLLPEVSKSVNTMGFVKKD